MADQMAIETQSITSVTPSYRRNGKLFSCEPCRRGKLRCDHSSPVCGRCARRNKPDQCIYHPAPLTKPRNSPGTTQQQQQRTPAPSPKGSTTTLSSRTIHSQSNTKSPEHHSIVHNQLQHQHQPQQTFQQQIHHQPQRQAQQQQQHQSFSAFRPLNQIGNTLSQHATLKSPTMQQPTMATPTSADDRQTSSSISYTSPESSTVSYRDSKAGFLGPTSYSAVYTEHVTDLDAMSEADEVEPSSILPPVTAERIQQGADVLALLRDLPIYQQFMQRWFDVNEGTLLMSPACRIWMSDLWSEFGQLLQECRPDQLRSLSELVWRNTRKPIHVTRQTNARDWARSVTGRNLRWEVVGSIMSLVGLIAMGLSDWDAIFDSIREKFVDRATFADRMRKASEFILCFCYECEYLNELYVCFMYENLILVEMFKGEAHYVSWQRAGEICDAIVAMGLHQGNSADKDTPFFLVELRKKMFISIYSRDKYIASFLGRPPRLSHRYCKMEMPLDLSDEQLFLEGSELEQALSTIDANGWNTQGTVSRTTWQRIVFHHSRIREDILEIALGSGDDDISYRAEEVRRKLDLHCREQVGFMQIQPEEIIKRSLARDAAPYPVGRIEVAVGQITCIFVLCLHAGVAQTQFLLQRALINRGRADTKELIPISRRLLELTLLAQSKRDFFRDFQADLVYIMANYGLSAAAVLAIELLKQEQSRQFTPDILPRSETIQDLSVFISALATVGPGEGNYTICNQGRRVLKKVLDQILSPVPVHPVLGTAGQDGNQSVGTGQQPDDMSLFFPTANDADFLQWLENIEWERAGNWPSTAGQEGA